MAELVLPIFDSVPQMSVARQGSQSTENDKTAHVIIPKSPSPGTPERKTDWVSTNQVRLHVAS